MAQIPLDCPYCATAKAAFTIREARPVEGYVHAALGQCAVCNQCVVIRFWCDSSILLGDGSLRSGVTLMQYDPQPPAAVAPEATPPLAASLYVQALKALQQGHYDTCAPTFRRTIEVSLKTMAPELEPGMRLVQRIEAVPAARGLTPAMQSWAHQVRLLGNDGAHEEAAVTQEDAEDLQAFTELFLTYAFTLPKRLENSIERRQQRKRK